jgi:threonylcarbamoyladenosine tRNA methylthiotransferase CDKAL1
VRSFGCSANTADSEVISGCLSQAGFDLAGSEADADVIVYNSCAVKGPTENRVIDALKRIPTEKKVVVAGCLPLISFERLLREVRFDAAVGAAVGEGIVDIVQRVLHGEKVVELDRDLASMPTLDLPRVQTNPVVSVIPVSYGCLGSCAYCCVVNARGHLRSHKVGDVVERVKQDVASGAREIWITSQDTGCYGKEIGSNLAALLKAVAAIEGDFRVRVGMMTPNMIVPFLDELIEAFRSEKIFKFVHLPVQSGDDEVLRRMRRCYTIQEFKDTVATLRAAYPLLTLSTDIICGFPGENANAFENTLRLIREAQPDIVNVSKFFARPKTAAWEMHNLSIEKTEIKHRSAQAAELARKISLERNQRWLAWSGDILVDEKGKFAGSWVGRNFAYKPIVFKSDENLIGKKLCVKVRKVFSTHLDGVLE